MKHDVIVVGASAGGVDVLLDMAGELPARLPASIFIVIHMPPGYSGQLAELLTARGQLPASYPLHNEKIEPGRIYIAPSDTQLLLRQGFVEVVRGPTENGKRPAVDALFRTASWSYGPRVIGVVLSGYQDCGTAGMMSIKARGGVTVVQQPDSAVAPEMPKSVIDHVEVDHIVAPLELPGLLSRLVSTEAAPEIMPERPIRQLEGQELGAPAGLSCPLCQGVLTESGSGSYRHFLCHVGHAFSLESLLMHQGEEMERALWAAVRALEESASVSRRLASGPTSDLQRKFVEKAATQTRHAERIRQILLHGDDSFPQEAQDAPPSSVQ